MSTRPPEQAGLNGEAHSICLQGQGRGHGHQPQGQLRHGEGLLIITRGGCLAELRAGSEHQTEAEEDSEPGLRAELRTGAPILPAGGAGAAPPSSRGSSGAGEGGSLHPASRSTGGDWALGCPGGLISSLPGVQAGAGVGTGPSPPSVPGAAHGAGGRFSQITEYGAGGLETHWWGRGGDKRLRKFSGPTGGAGAQPSPKGSRVGRKHPPPVLALGLGQHPQRPASPGAEPPATQGREHRPHTALPAGQALAPGQAWGRAADLHRDVGVHGGARHLHQAVLQRADPVPLHGHLGVLDLGEPGGDRSGMRLGEKGEPPAVGGGDGGEPAAGPRRGGQWEVRAAAPCSSPLRVGLVVFVTFVLDHAVPPNADVGPRHLHAVQGDPEGQQQKGISARPDPRAGHPPRPEIPGASPHQK